MPLVLWASSGEPSPAAIASVAHVHERVYAPGVHVEQRRLLVGRDALRKWLLRLLAARDLLELRLAALVLDLVQAIGNRRLLGHRDAALLDRSRGGLQGLRVRVCQQLVAAIGEDPSRIWRRRLAELALDFLQARKRLGGALVACWQARELICQRAGALVKLGLLGQPRDFRGVELGEGEALRALEPAPSRPARPRRCQGRPDRP